MDLRKRAEFSLAFNDAIDEAGSICILGHINPDGDCLGSTLSTMAYIKRRYADKGFRNRTVKVYLDVASEKFAYLEGFHDICHEDSDQVYDLCIVLDCGDAARVGHFLPLLKAAKRKLCVDHHITNEGFAELSLIEQDASSTSELMADLFEERYVDRAIAEALYTGIVHDTGVFRYDCTSPHTMEVAGRCMSYGIDFGEIIDDSFFAMTAVQKAALGRVLSEMEVCLEGRIVFGHIEARTMELYGVTSREMDGIVDQLRTTRGALGAIFMYQCKNRSYKASLRSNTDELNVAAIAQTFGGGGHLRAAGCFMGPDLKDDKEKLLSEIRKQLGT